MTDEAINCGHFPCSCIVPGDDAYCSESCREIAEGPVPDTEVSFSTCPCHHPGCK